MTTTNYPVLTPRLQAIADEVPIGSIIADVGTDHAYIPVYLTAKKICPFAYAGDIGEGPLENAAHTVKKYGVENKVKLILSPGLEEFPDDCCNTLIIAGMGGDQIGEIISAAKWLRRDNITLILQPMTMHERCRSNLAALGFDCVRERYVVEGKRVYVVMVYTLGMPHELDSVTAYIGESADSSDSSAHAYFMSRKQKLREVLNGLRKSDRMQEETMRCSQLLEKLEEL